MKVYAVCLICGYKLFKAEMILECEIKCPRCSSFLAIDIHNDEIKISILKTGKLPLWQTASR